MIRPHQIRVDGTAHPGAALVELTASAGLTRCHAVTRAHYWSMSDEDRNRLVDRLRRQVWHDLYGEILELAVPLAAMAKTLDPIRHGELQALATQLVERLAYREEPPK